MALLGLLGFTLFLANMYFLILLSLSKRKLEENYELTQVSSWTNIFQSGAIWMQTWLSRIRQEPILTNQNTNFTFHGIFKYSVCLLAFGLAFCGLAKINLLLAPLSIIIFYWFEVHFLFLFPLLIDDVKSPIISSIRLTYKVGVMRAIFNVLPIGIFMFIGLFDYRKPLHNWHIGCLAVLIWYEYETRDRL
jgi:hypothetical protein